MTVLTRIRPNSAVDVEVGEINERLPSTTVGLISYFPFDGTPNGTSPNSNVASSEGVWTVGTYGSQGYFYLNGEPSANAIILKPNPWNVPSPVWASETNDVASDADGGWDMSGRPVDRTKRYRISVWLRRENIGNGSSYLGVQGNTVWNLGTTDLNNNPYGVILTSGSMSSYANEWLLWLFHVHPYDYAGSTLSSTGVYRMNGTKIYGGTDFRWTSTTATSGMRSYLYYSTSTAERQYWYDPRMEIVNDYTSSVTDLIAGYAGAVMPSSETNVCKSFREGIGIYSPATNLISPIFSVWYPWNGLTGTYESYLTVHGRTGVHVKVTSGGGVQYYDVSSRASVSPSTTYTVSATVKVKGLAPSANLFYLREYRSNGTQVSERGIYDHSRNVYLENGWVKSHATFTTSSETIELSVTGYEYDADREIWIEDLQLEQRSYYTGYAPSPRTGGGDLTLPIQNEPSTYTIVGKFLPHTPFDGTYNLTANQAVLFALGDVGDAGHMYYRYYVGGSISAPFLDADGTFGTSHVHQYYDVEALKPVHYVVKKSGGTLTCALHQNGAWKATHTSTFADGTKLSYVRLGADTVWNGDHRWISVYDRILSDAEITNAIGRVQVLMPNGVLSCVLNEDENPNLWPNSNLNTTTYGVIGLGSVTLKTDSYGTYHEMIISNLSYAYRGYDVATDSGSTYVFSGWFWVSAGNTFNYTPLAIEGAQSSEPYPLITSMPTETWTYYQRYCVADSNVRFLVYPTAGTPGSGTIKWRNVSVRKLPTNSIRLNSYGEMSVGEFSE